MRVIGITGGAGYVGRRLAIRLLEDEGFTIGEIRLLDIQPSTSVPLTSTSTKLFAPSIWRQMKEKRKQKKKNNQGEDTNGKETENHDDDDDDDDDSYPINTPSSKITYRRCDLCDFPSLLTALEGVDTIIHLASYGMSGREMLQVERIRQVNVDGTKHVIQACLRLNIKRLIYVSTYNVVFGGQEIINGNEDEVPYYPMDQFHDEYSKTKRIAEQLVLRANSPQLSTCAIRPAAIYGDGEERHLPRIFNHVRMGLGLAAIGTKDILCDWTYVDNLCHAIILAASSLTLTGHHSPAAGQAYCISDDSPINNFDFLRPLCEGLGYSNVFQFYIPTPFMFYLAWLLEILRSLLLWLTCGRLSFQPILTRAEVQKVGVTHYFSMAKAKRHLGYRPIVDTETAMKRCIEFYQQEFGRSGYQHRTKDEPDTNHRASQGQRHLTHTHGDNDLEQRRKKK